MEAVQRIIREAEGQGVELFDIEPAVIPGRGIGMVASRDLFPGDVITKVPLQAARSIHTVPPDISGSLPSDVTIHGLLAAELALHGDDFADWMSTVPSWADLEASVPMLWPLELQELLPKAAKQILSDQRQRFQLDWESFQKGGFTTKSLRDYLYAWLLVSTRTFYFETETTLRYPWHDRLALLPVADLFNHADTGCSVTISPEEYEITADRPYQAGQEVYTSYGEHSNDYLLVEYGFSLGQNRWDKLHLDDLLLAKLSAGHKSELESRGHLGDLFLRNDRVRNSNVWIALRLTCCEDPRWEDFEIGIEDEKGTLATAAEMLLLMLDELLDEIKATQQAITKLTLGTENQRSQLLQRWEQLEVFARQVIRAESDAEI